MKRQVSGCIAALVTSWAFAGSPEVPTPTPSPAGAMVYIIDPTAGAKVKNPLRVRFGLRGMGIAPAGVAVENTGHHHLLIDGEAPAPGQPIPNDSTHLHFGKGQTEAELTLPVGKHRLQLVLGDHLHAPHQPPVVSAAVEIEVVD